MGKGQAQLKVIRKEMGISHSDFYATLPELLLNIPYQHTQDTIKFQFQGKEIEIVLEPEQVRELGLSISLPVTIVNLRFYDCSEDETNSFIKSFNLKFMRGGG